MNTREKTYKLVLTALFLALCLVLPFVTGGIPTIGNMLLPMHIPVLLCGLLCGWQYGLVIGFVAPAAAVGALRYAAHLPGGPGHGL